MNTQERIHKKLKQLPLSPGVYFMKDKDGKIIYVGKSKLLKNRVSSYFMNTKNHTPKTRALVSCICDFDYMVTDNEVEALVLECTMIKKYRPKYNILLKDDKQYPYIKITVQEDYPRISMTRRVVKDGAKYFGPYMSAYMVKDTLETIKRIFQVRSCNKKLPEEIGKGRPCLYYQMHRCSAPCSDKISKEEYREVFERIADVLEGKFDDVRNLLKEKMYFASDRLEFEKAARYRDKIENLNVLGEKQKMISQKENNRDIIGFYQDDTEVCIQIFYMREGKISGSEYFILEQEFEAEEEVISGFLKEYYFQATMIPKEILIPVSIEDSDEIEVWLQSKTGAKTKLLVPKRGEKNALVQMVCKNAEESLQKHRFRRDKDAQKQNAILAKLMHLLELPCPPFRIESYDISNISGSQSTGACIVYQNAKPSKKDYRRFHIKTVDGANDYESMREVIYRRIQRAYSEMDEIKSGTLTEGKAKFLPLPDLILLDGGKGHVSAVNLLMETLGEEIPVYGMVKDDKHRTRGLTDEHEEFPLERNSELFLFLTGMQEEVHRFAIAGFRKKHEKATLASDLLSVPGIGKEKHKKLLQAFGSRKKMKSASMEELRKIVGARAAKELVLYFSHEGKDEK